MESCNHFSSEPPSHELLSVVDLVCYYGNHWLPCGCFALLDGDSRNDHQRRRPMSWRALNAVIKLSLTWPDTLAPNFVPIASWMHQLCTVWVRT